MSTLTNRWPATGGLLLGILAATTPAFGQCTYTSTPIIYPINCGIGPVLTKVTGLNDDGWVCGYYWCVLSQYDRGFYRTPAGEYVDIGLPANAVGTNPTDINNNGQICGWVDTESNGGFRAFVYEITTGEWTIIEPANPKLGWSFAGAINDAGMVVGRRSFTFNPQPQPLGAFLWTPEGGAIDLGVMDGPHSTARHVSSDGHVTGWAGGSNASNGVPFCYADDQLFEIPAPVGSVGGAGTQFSESETELLAQYSILVGERKQLVRRPYVWSMQTGEVIEYVPLPEFDRALGYDLLNRYAVVGESDDTDNVNLDRATIWLNGEPIELLDLVPECHCTHLDVALQINRHGLLVVSGATEESSSTAFLLEPIAPRDGDVTADCRVGVEDLLQLLRDWGRTDVPTDLNTDGIVNVIDLLTMLGKWG